MNKFALFAIIMLTFCGAALWFLAAGSLDNYVKTQIEQLGSNYSEQQVTVDKVEINLLDGLGKIDGLVIANSAKYQQKAALSLGSIALDINLGSLPSTPIIIDSFTINNAEALVEFSSDGKSNYQELIAAIARNLPKPAENQQTDKKPSSPQTEPKIRIDQLTLAGVGMTVDLVQLGNRVHQQTLPTINLAMIGGIDGAPASQLGGEIAKQIIKAIWQQAIKTQQQQLQRSLTDKLKEKAADKLDELIPKRNR